MTFQGANLLFVPSESQDLKIIDLPHPLTGNLNSYLLSGDALYELREIGDDNPHDKNNYLRPLTKKDNLPVRSLILEGRDKSGLILEDGVIIVSTKFDIVFTLISFFSTQTASGREFTRFQSDEDISDMIQEEIPALSRLPDFLLKRALIKICESVNEGEEDFYKYSQTSCLKFLRNKVTLITETFPQSIKKTIVEPILYPIGLDEQTPSELTELALQRYAIYLLGSYLPEVITNDLLNSYDFQELDDYISLIQKKKAEKLIAEENLDSMNSLNAQNKRSMEKQGKGGPKKKAMPTKDPAQKVSRGPLDMLFKKK